MDASKDAEDAPAATTSVMGEVVSCALAVLPAKPEKLEKHQLQLLTILEQVGMERPAAFQSSLALLQRWLDVDTQCQDADAGPSSAELDLPICACNILAQVLPHWAEHTSTLSKQSQARKLMAQLGAPRPKTAKGKGKKPQRRVGRVGRVGGGGGLQAESPS